MIDIYLVQVQIDRHVAGPVLLAPLIPGLSSTLCHYLFPALLPPNKMEIQPLISLYARAVSPFNCERYSTNSLPTAPLTSVGITQSTLAIYSLLPVISAGQHGAIALIKTAAHKRKVAS